MSELKNEWKTVGIELGHAAKGLGKVLIRTVATGADKLQDWIEKEEEKRQK